MTRPHTRLVAAVALLAAPVLAAGAQQAGVTALPDSTVARIDRAFAALTGSETPGCAVGVSRAGQPVLSRAYGMANLEYGVPNTPETIFESGSVAKQFTSAVLVLLQQDGKLSLDDDIRKHLPEVPDFGKKITIRNLLTHTSGLRDQWGLLSLKGSPPGSQVHTLPLILDLVAHQKSLNFEPGAEYLYSNTGYALAAVIVSRVSGMPFATFSQERLFKPLGMTNTQWRDDFTRVVKNRATAYDGNPRTGFRMDMPFTNVHGNGGLLTTVGDMLKWNAFLDAPTAALGGASFVQAMETTPYFNNGKPSDYALGLVVTTRGGVREVSHSGSTAGYRTSLVRYPEQRVSVAVLCNAAGAPAVSLGNQVGDIVVPHTPRAVQAGAPADAGPALTAAQLERYTGLFRQPTTQNLLRAVVRDGKLTTTSPQTLTLAPAGTDRFRVPGQGVLQYRFANGKAREVLLIGETDTTRYEAMAAVSPSPAQLAAYAGSYWSDELESRVTIEVRDTALVVKRRPADQTTLRATFSDAFQGPGLGTVVFSRDSRGRVNGFGIWAGRVRNVRFTKEQ